MTKNHHRERGAALLTVLLMSTLMLAAGGTLLLVTTLSGRTAIDSTAELQAYYAAEGGLQAALDVLRGNVSPNGPMPSGSKINFRNAITLAASNLPADTSTSPRLSGWLSYDYTPTGLSLPDRVSLTSSYAPQNGMAFSVELSDPDNTPVASGEPSRLRLRVTGYGPKGGLKKLELIVNKSNFDFTPVATIMMRSADDGTPMTFSTGNSAAKDYSGHDHGGSGAVLPAFGSTTNGDMNIQIDASNKNTVANPIAENVAMSKLPTWLQSASQARALLATQKANAVSQGRYFTSFSGNSGSSASPAFTYVDGDCSLGGGAGLLIVTGELTMSGNPSFEGLILVLGEGSVNRNGGGNGNIYGSITVAKFDKTGNGGFLAPNFHTNGGGNSTIQYDSVAVRKALNLGGPVVMGVREF